ncbi:uncharacterized protein PFL1_02742 [Pseudozyma flocculosa PF-1]|uniref:Related to Lactamase, beta 2 n=2 Tax=Pseudozyma flocculosa TaxID=84751 RepID=A0A5C3F243_9BASI|nr:uncharacterized protein PFL1_02742 [Pseudozyma flocculosa PF-1]EPQ29523.1 hypothetical protein PFL1_02742 [Pseudozyma flocculosa PF-1]SPO38065.1 related to Lactamase, beta 2 [Pseudozyma flocculosa]
MAELKPVSDLARLSSRVVRILAQNPGPYTLNGTNTYLVSAPSSSSPSSSSLPTTAARRGILIDTGEGVEGYIPLLERALRGGGGGDEGADASTMAAIGDEGVTTWVSDIILTHRHGDHTKGLPSVLSLLSRLRSESQAASATTAATSTPLAPPRIHKLPDTESDPSLIESLHALPSGSFTSYSAFDGPSPLWPLKDGDIIACADGDEAGATSLQVVHTPGHTADHICLLLREERNLFSGDHVLGSGTTVFEDLNAYLASLSRCIDLFAEIGPSSSVDGKDGRSDGSNDTGDDENVIYPAHGPVVAAGRATLRTYLSHRLERERQILSLLSTAPPPSAQTEAERGWTITSLVSTLYSAYPEHLFPAAARGLFLHLHALSVDNPQAGRRKRVRPRSLPEFAKGQPRAATEAEAGVVPIPKNESQYAQVMDIVWDLIPDQGESGTEQQGAGGEEQQASKAAAATGERL